MLRNQYIMLGVLCASGLIQASAQEAERTPLTSASTGKLQLSDCFKLKTTLTPGPQRFYEPVIVGKVFELDLTERLFDIHVSTRTTKLIRGVCGLVEGDDEELTKAAAELIAAGLSTWSMEELVGDEYGQIDINSKKSIQRRIINNDIAQIKKLLNTQCILVIFQGTHDKPVPQKIQTCSQGKFGDIILSKYIASTAHDVAGCLIGPHTSREQLGILAKYAATVAISHKASFLEFDQERYAQFLLQELGEKIN